MGDALGLSRLPGSRARGVLLRQPRREVGMIAASAAFSLPSSSIFRSSLGDRSYPIVIAWSYATRLIPERLARFRNRPVLTIRPARLPAPRRPRGARVSRVPGRPHRPHRDPVRRALQDAGDLRSHPRSARLLEHRARRVPVDVDAVAVGAAASERTDHAVEQTAVLLERDRQTIVAGNSAQSVTPERRRAPRYANSPPTSRVQVSPARPVSNAREPRTSASSALSRACTTMAET